MKTALAATMAATMAATVAATALTAAGGTLLVASPTAGAVSHGAPGAPESEAATKAPTAEGVIAYIAMNPKTRREVIYRIGTDGSNRRQLTDGVTYNPAWSPDGTQIAYVRRSDSTIRLMDATGANKRGTGEVVYAADGPAWSPDGRRLSYACGTGGDLCVLNLTTRERTIIVPRTRAWPAANSSSWSADGNWIAFARVSREGDDYSSNQALFLVHPDGTGLTEIPNTTPLAHEPAWSPDGQSLVYTERYDGRGGGSGSLYSIRPDGTGRTPLLAPRGNEGDVAWSSDGQRIAFGSSGWRYPYAAGIWTTAPDGSDGQLVARDGWSPTWQPNQTLPTPPGPTLPATTGRRIAYLAATDEGYDVFTVRPDGTGKRRLTTEGDAGGPAWSPDHSQLVFTRRNTLWTMNADGEDRRLLATTAEWAPLDDPAWSPNGRRIVVAREDILIVVNVRTLERRRIPAGSGWYNTSPTWSPDGRQIAFSSTFGVPGGIDIMLVAANGGSKARRMARLPGEEGETSWGPRGHRIVFTQVRDPWRTRPDRVVSTTLRGTDLRVLHRTAGVDHGGTWAPSGARLALFSDGPNPFGSRPRPGLWTVGPRGQDPQWVVRDRTITDIDW